MNDFGVIYESLVHTESNARHLVQQYDTMISNLTAFLRCIRTAKSARRAAISAAVESKRRRRTWSYKKDGQWWENIYPTLIGNRFRDRFRVTRDVFLYLVKELTDDMTKMDTRFRKAITVEKRVAITLYTLASNAEYKTIGHLFGVGKSTVGLVLHEFCSIVTRKWMPVWIQFPNKRQEVRNHVEMFETRWQFEQCIGAIDGFHIEVSPTQVEEGGGGHHEGRCSFVLLACVSADYKFTYVDVSSSGRNDAEHILRNSNLYSSIASRDLFQYEATIESVQVPALLLGSSAFPLMPCLMKPFVETTAMSEEQWHFNYRLCRTRRVVEDAFGRLKARFRRLSKRLEFSVANSRTIVQTCCVIHNIAETYGDVPDCLWIEEASRASLSNSVRPQMRDINESNNQEAIHIRDALKRRFHVDTRNCV